MTADVGAKDNSSAMYVATTNDCTFSMSPVTSGARVSFVYDLLVAPPDGRCAANNRWEEDREAHTPNMYPFPIMRINPAHERALLDKLDSAMAKFDSVTIGLNGVYPVTSDNTTRLRQGDQVLFEFLKERYILEIVPVIVHEDRAGIYSESAIDQIIAGRPERSHKNPCGKDMLVIPHTMSDMHVLDEVYSMCGRVYEEVEKHDVVYRISGLRLTKRNT